MSPLYGIKHLSRISTKCKCVCVRVRVRAFVWAFVCSVYPSLRCRGKSVILSLGEFSLVLVCLVGWGYLFYVTTDLIFVFINRTIHVVMFWIHVKEKQLYFISKIDLYCLESITKLLERKNPLYIRYILFIHLAILLMYVIMLTKGSRSQALEQSPLFLKKQYFTRFLQKQLKTYLYKSS